MGINEFPWQAVEKASNSLPPHSYLAQQGEKIKESSQFSDSGC
jgi:hypothetical protein